MSRLPNGSVTKNGEATPLLNQIFLAFYQTNEGFERRKQTITEEMVVKNCEAVKKLSGVELSTSAMKQYLTYGAGKWLTESHQQLHSYEMYGRFYMNAIAPLERAKKLKAKMLIKNITA
jgi:S-adenosylmethionine/arginine decarboxylase-like enzyme